MKKRRSTPEQKKYRREYYKNKKAGIIPTPQNKSPEEKAKMLIKKKEKTNQRLREKRKSDPNYMLRNRLGSRIRMALKYSGERKTKKTAELIGCTIEDFKTHLESRFAKGMSWSNTHKWHIDHIIPCAAFNLADPVQQKQCFHYTNLQPMWAAENIRKSNKIKEPIQMLLTL